MHQGLRWWYQEASEVHQEGRRGSRQVPRRLVLEEVAVQEVQHEAMQGSKGQVGDDLQPHHGYRLALGWQWLLGQEGLAGRDQGRPDVRGCLCGVWWQGQDRCYLVLLSSHLGR